MAKSFGYRILSALLLLAIVIPVFPALLPTQTLAAAEAAEVEPAAALPEGAVVSDFTVPRSAERKVEPLPGATTIESWSSPLVVHNELKHMANSPGYTPVYSPPSAPLSYQPVEDYVFAAVAAGVARYDGNSWSMVNTGLPSNTTAYQFAVDPFNPTTLLVATNHGVYTTTDALGLCQWSQTTLITSTRSIVAHPWQQGEFYAGSSDNGHFSKSTDFGKTWHTQRLPSTGGAREWLDCASDIAIGTYSGDVVYAPNGNGQDGRHTFWKSIDGGESFVLSNTITNALSTCAVEPGSDEVLYMGGVSYIVRSTDGGSSWIYIRDPNSGQYLDVVVGPYNNHVWTTNSTAPGQVLWTAGPWPEPIWQTVTLGGGPRAVAFGGPGTIWVGGVWSAYPNKTFIWMNEGNGTGPWLDRGIVGLYSGDVYDLAPLARYYYALVSPTLSLVVVMPTAVTADGVDTAAITVTVLGEHGLPIPGVTVVLTHTGVATLTQPVSPTDALGRAFGSIRSSQAGVVNVSAYASGVDLGETVPVTFVGADLAVAKTGPAVASPEETLTYTLVLANAGRLAAAGVVVTDTLPAELAFITHTAPFTFSRNGPVLTWDVGALANGAATSWTVTVTLALTAPQGAELENAVTAGSPAAEHDLVNNQAAVTTRVLDALAGTPDNPFLAVAAGGRADLAITVRNTGPNTVHDLGVTLPPTVPGLSATPSNLGELGPGTDTVFTLTAAPPTTTLSGYYQGVVLVQSAGGAQAGVGLTLYVAGGPTGTVVFSVTDELAAAVVGAELTLISTTGELSFHGQAGPEGTYTFNSIPQGSYLYQVGAPGYAVFWGSAEVTGTHGQINVILASDYVDYEWWAEETTITDTYNIYLTITYQLGNRPLLVPCGPWLEAPLQGGTYRGEFCLYNPSGVPLTNVHLERGTLDADIGVSFENGGDLGSVATSRTVAITFTSGVGFADNYAAGDLLVLGVYSENHPFRSVLHVLVNPAPITCTCTLEGNLFRTHCYWPRQPGGGGGGGGGGGAPPPPYIPPPPNPPPPEQVHLRLSQGATLARQAFVANLAMANHSPEDLTAVSITLTIRDAQGQDARAFFGVDDTQARWGSLEAGEHRTWRWTLVPLACAGGTEPRGLDYYISATVAFSVNGNLVGFQTVPERLTVRPQPRLFLYYYLPAAIEAGVPFRVQIVAQDWGSGPARDLRMSVPALQTSGAEGVEFQVVGSDLEFGDIAPFQLALGYVDLRANVDATVESVGAQLRQRDLRGLALNPLILSASVYLVYSESVQLEAASSLPDPGPECAPSDPPPAPHLVRVVGTTITVTAFPGDLVTHTYTVYNLNLSDPISISLEADSEHDWTVEVSGTGRPGGGAGIQVAEGTIVVAPGRGVPVRVRLQVPGDTPYGTTDLETLLGAYYFNPLLSDSDNTTTRVAPVKILRIEVTPGTTLSRNDDGWYTPDPLTYTVVIQSQVAGNLDRLAFHLKGSERLRTIPVMYQPSLETGHDWFCDASDCSETLLDWPIVVGENRIAWRIWVQPTITTTLRGYAWLLWENLPEEEADAPDVQVPLAQIHPVVVIPGSLGTWEPSINGRLEPFYHTYDPLLNHLEALGYERSVSLIEFPYDWRQSVVDIAPFLDDRIYQVTQDRPGSKLYVDYSQADVVAHSMGGLVARAYLESNNYRDDIGKLITLATPHQGAPEDYLLWEGLHIRNMNDWSMLYLYSRLAGWTLVHGHCRFHCPPPGEFCSFCPPDDWLEYVHDDALGFRDLLPAGELPAPYLLRAADPHDPYPFGQPENPFLDDLNSCGGTYDFCQLVDSGPECWALFSTNYDWDTVLGFDVEETVFTTTLFWEHGQPAGTGEDGYNKGTDRLDLDQSGDGVVPAYSAAASHLGWTGLSLWSPDVNQGGAHAGIPSECLFIDRTAGFLTGIATPPGAHDWGMGCWQPEEPLP